MTTRNCKKQSCKDEDGNCPIPGSDGLPVQCVCPWVEDKYFFLEKYLNASCEARRKFADKNNAVFIDLFAGPGKCIIKNEKEKSIVAVFGHLKETRHLLMSIFILTLAVSIKMH